ncbi:MAG TPA: hypothetical protein PK530_04675 [Anaerolineales bacterium]|nr:hypothetical protein [Anaerolineales bacterium]
MKPTPSRFLLLISALALSILACSFGASGTSPDATPSPKILFQDDFSSKSNEWLQIRDEEGITDFDQNGYRIMVDKTEWIFWANPGISLSNLKIDIDASKIGGPEANEFGVICRYVDKDNFYFFTITSDGFYSVNKVIAGEYEFIGMDDFGTTDAVQAGNALNHLTVECNGNSLKFWVNGTLLSETQDDSFTVGDIGLIAGTSDTAGTDILFDNLVVTEP